MSDDGRAYGRTAGYYDPELAEVAAGTPAGELLRRYWHPVALSDARRPTCRAPCACSARTSSCTAIARARPGCSHRAAATAARRLLYGKVEEHGIRCCYHGWLFDADGTLPRPAVRARSRAQPRALPAAVVPGRRVPRPDLRLHGSARAAAGVPALRHLRGSRRRRGDRDRRSLRLRRSRTSRRATGSRPTRTRWTRTTCSSSTTRSAATSSAPTSRCGRRSTGSCTRGGCRPPRIVSSPTARCCTGSPRCGCRRSG